MIRISQNMIYDSAVRHSNDALRSYYELSVQNSTQKRVNKPSDDPSAMAQILDLRSRISTMGDWLDNGSTAKGWLAEADSQLGSASETLTSLIEKAEQAATGTLTDSNREAVAASARGLFNQLLGIANSDYNGSSIFAGSRTDSAAYKEILGATVEDPGLDDSAVVQVTGSADHSILVEFTSGGTIGGASDLTYRYSSDGSKTWTSATLAAGGTALDLGSATMTMQSGATVSDATGAAQGTTVVVRPAAQYLGTAGDTVTMTNHGAAGIAASATGAFHGDVLVRIDQDATLSGPIGYSYSLDSGSTWTSGGTASGGTLSVPGGVVRLTGNGSTALAAGDQFVVRPAKASIGMEVGQGATVTVNGVGRDIFGGLVSDSTTGGVTNGLPRATDENSFEVAGELIGYLETNDRSGITACLDKLKTAQKRVLGAASTVGARENLVTTTLAAVTAMQAGITTNLSSIEDADVVKLTTDLTQAQTVYQAVLKTSSKIMGMSLLDYI
jgi:flagellar hook-associated protein 3 FlgL